ncbi:hypothetical protein BU14_0305s0011 [Porphyra umbilicalis]|uniref:Uncharacterized protein n=1 Tax=Porphyra umbilicalis TaxID=2786 RepID=A0A1X6NZX6_PORUM|nr:hypothetical protein BU14_0305s0011 [Porphyra umbilicalis]|eukprot:OSX74168.1 hypothetical protein BU14_0305s0011 [Porphyra umbilicalis]
MSSAKPAGSSVCTATAPEMNSTLTDARTDDANTATAGSSRPARATATTAAASAAWGRVATAQPGQPPPVDEPGGGTSSRGDGADARRGGRRVCAVCCVVGRAGCAPSPGWRTVSAGDMTGKAPASSPAAAATVRGIRHPTPDVMEPFAASAAAAAKASGGPALTGATGAVRWTLAIGQRGAAGSGALPSAPPLAGKGGRELRRPHSVANAAVATAPTGAGANASGATPGVEVSGTPPCAAAAAAAVDGDMPRQHSGWHMARGPSAWSPEGWDSAGPAGVTGDIGVPAGDGRTPTTRKAVRGGLTGNATPCPSAGGGGGSGAPAKGSTGTHGAAECAKAFAVGGPGLAGAMVGGRRRGGGGRDCCSSPLLAGGGGGRLPTLPIPPPASGAGLPALVAAADLGVPLAANALRGARLPPTSALVASDDAGPRRRDRERRLADDDAPAVVAAPLGSVAGVAGAASAASVPTGWGLCRRCSGAGSLLPPLAAGAAMAATRRLTPRPAGDTARDGEADWPTASGETTGATGCTGAPLGSTAGTPPPPAPPPSPAVPPIPATIHPPSSPPSSASAAAGAPW